MAYRSLKITIVWLLKGEGDVIIRGLKRKIVEPSSNFGRDHCIHFRINAPRKDINSSFLLPPGLWVKLTKQTGIPYRGWQPVREKDESRICSRWTVTKIHSVEMSYKPQIGTVAVVEIQIRLNRWAYLERWWEITLIYSVSSSRNTSNDLFIIYPKRVF